MPCSSGRLLEVNQNAPLERRSGSAARPKRRILTHRKGGNISGPITDFLTIQLWKACHKRRQFAVRSNRRVLLQLHGEPGCGRIRLMYGHRDLQQWGRQGCGWAEPAGGTFASAPPFHSSRDMPFRDPYRSRRGQGAGKQALPSKRSGEFGRRNFAQAWRSSQGWNSSGQPIYPLEGEAVLQRQRQSCLIVRVCCSLLQQDPHADPDRPSPSTRRTIAVPPSSTPASSGLADHRVHFTRSKRSRR